MATIRLDEMVQLAQQLEVDEQETLIQLLRDSIQRSRLSSTPVLTREEARQKLKAHGWLAILPPMPADVIPLSHAELLRLTALRTDSRSALDYINEDRGEW